MYKKSPQGWLKHWDFIILDIFCLQLAFVVAYLVRQGLENPYSDQIYRTVAFVFMLCQIVVMFLGQSYQDILKRGYYIEFTKTVKHGLKAIKEDNEETKDIVVIIHDGNRPMLPQDVITDNLVKQKLFGSAVTVIPTTETGHIIMDYSIHDAIEAGFNKVVFIIRKDIENEFKEVIGDRIAGICSEHNVTVDYAFQDINDIPGVLSEGRTKPWGTGQAVLAAKDVLTTPFIVINADDYYGKEGFRAVHEYLVNGGQSCMAGFVLKNTLSDNGGVTRGICKMDAENNLTEVVETKNIIKTTEGAEADGMKLDIDSLVSMNMWGLTPDFLKTLEEGFKEFFEKEVPANPLKAEYLIPTFIGELLSEGKISVKALRTNDTWYGMTYKEDVAAVKESFSKMLENGTYKGDLFSDL